MESRITALASYGTSQASFTAEAFEPDLWEMLRGPGILREEGALDLLDMIPAELEDCRDLQPVMERGVGFQVLEGQGKEPGGGPQPGAVFGMGGTQMLLFEMHKGACQLDEALEEGVIGPGILQPQMFQDVVGFVVIPSIKACKPSGVTRVEPDLLGAEVFHHGLNPVAFFHRRASG